MTREELEKYLYTMAESGRVANSILIDGAADAEDRAVAERFIKKLMGSTDHPDVIRIEHEKPNLISAKELRLQVCDNVMLKPYAKPYKIYPIEMDLVNTQGQNILLKTLEEPPQYAVFILFSKSAELLLETVRSRCLILKLGEKDGTGDVPEEVSRRISQIASELPFAGPAGGMKLASELIQINEAEKATFDEIFDIIKKIYRDALINAERGAAGRLEKLGDARLLSMSAAAREAQVRIGMSVNKTLALNDMVFRIQK